MTCCDMHNEHCEPPSELCCDRCTEIQHPGHLDGSRCVLDVPLNEWNDWTRRHEHIWTDSDPELFTKELKRCKVCGETAPNQG